MCHKISIDEIELDIDNYHYIDKKKKYEYRHHFIDGLEKRRSEWTNLTAYHYARKFDVGIVKTEKKEN